jgi:hypothetical protein
MAAVHINPEIQKNCDMHALNQQSSLEKQDSWAPSSTAIIAKAQSHTARNSRHELVSRRSGRLSILPYPIKTRAHARVEIIPTVKQIYRRLGYIMTAGPHWEIGGDSATDI